MNNKLSGPNRVSLALLAFNAVLFLLIPAPSPAIAQQPEEGKSVRASQVSQLPSREKRWALIIGIDKYEKDVSSLSGAVNDAKALKDVLVRHAGFPEHQVILLTTDAADPDHLPKRENILDALNRLGEIPEDGLLLFSFSGHGVSVGNQAYLIPSNGRITTNTSLLRDYSIDVERIKEVIKDIKVQQVLILLDACRNQPGRGDAPNLLDASLKGAFSFDAANSEVKAFATLYATSIGERAFEFHHKESDQFRGYFSFAIEEGLKGKAANERGEVTLGGLIKYVEDTVPKKVRSEKGEKQEPSKTIDGFKESSLILSIANDKNEPSPSTPQSSQFYARPGESAFWQAIENSTNLSDFETYLSKCRSGEFACTYKAVAELKASRLKKADAPPSALSATPTAPAPGSPPARTVTLREVELSFKGNLIDDTIRNARAFLETTPDSKEAHAYLGISLMIKKDVDNAVVHLEKAVRLGEPMTFPVKRLREPLLGHGLDDVIVAVTSDSVIIKSGKTYYQANFSGLSDARIEHYNAQCPIVHLKGTFVETSENSQKKKQGVKQFNLFPPSATLQPTRQGELVFNIAACTDEGTITLGIIKLMYRLMANSR